MIERGAVRAGPDTSPALPGLALAFGWVRHRRARPRPNAFAYRAFFLRVPVHALDGRAAGSWLLGVNRPGLLSFHEADHGPREAAARVDAAARSPLRAWIDGLLASAGLRADGEIWLHTFPRMLGYGFLPVSFWFCHRADGACIAVLAEVNNTFGERHSYLLAAPDGSPLPRGAELHARKCFHVSPFCPTEGGYRFRFLDAGRRTVARIDYDDADGLLLATSLSGTIAEATPGACVRALLAYPLFTAGVIARIHWQALKLWLKRVPIVRKPAPPTLAVSRGHR
jgi:DUF1365 family protein